MFSCAVYRREECYRLTQRKSASSPELMQGPSLLRPGQCPTVRLAATGTQHRKRLSLHYFISFSLLFFGPRSLFPIFPVTSLLFLVCRLQTHFAHISTFQLKKLHGSFNFIHPSVFKACGTLFAGGWKSARLKHCEISAPEMSLVMYFQPNCVVRVVYGELFQARTSGMWDI